MKKINKISRTEEQRMALIKRMIFNNPMKNPEVRMRVSNSKKGKVPLHPFPKNNDFWKRRKDLKNALNTEYEIPQTTTENTLNTENENKKIPQTDG